MKRKKKETPDEFRAWWEAREEGIQDLRRRAERIRLERAAKRKPASLPTGSGARLAGDAVLLGCLGDSCRDERRDVSVEDARDDVLRA